jgi:ATP-dependent helicase/DNAse subunit B
MKKFAFIAVMLFMTASLFSDPVDDAKSILEKSEQFYQEFQTKYKSLKAYDTSKRSKDRLKEMVDMINRYKKLVEEKIIEIDDIEKTGKNVPASEFDQLKNLIERYHEMTVNLANWVNTR